MIPVAVFFSIIQIFGFYVKVINCDKALFLERIKTQIFDTPSEPSGKKIKERENPPEKMVGR